LKKRWNYAKTHDDKLTAPLINERDIKMIGQNQYGMSQKDILKKHVSNYRELDLKQRRMVMGQIQA
jgi:hypothetical protein